MSGSEQPPFSGVESNHAVRWSDLAARSGFVDFLSPEDGFKTCVRTGQLWSNKDRPGIYFWLAEDGEAYIGQSVTPRSGLRQHVRDHGDLVRACFMPCPESDLNRVEEELINRLGGHFPLRNIKLAVATSREVPFDELVDATERERRSAGRISLKSRKYASSNFSNLAWQSTRKNRSGGSEFQLAGVFQHNRPIADIRFENAAQILGNLGHSSVWVDSPLPGTGERR